MKKDFLEKLYYAHREIGTLPSPEQIYHWIDDLLQLLFPEYSCKVYGSFKKFENQFATNRLHLFELFSMLNGRLKESPENLEIDFFHKLPLIRAKLMEDAGALLAGDPAAVNITEVIHTYPGFYATAIHRIAHELLDMKIPFLPRILSEYAHQKTGIDIHPGATIGARFCIDHGTGIVMGETCHIGDDVKIYQGVTLGALSVQKELANSKRHPTIEDNVVIYAGATILGGKTIIGRNTIIGGNVWLTKSVPPDSTIYFNANK